MRRKLGGLLFTSVVLNRGVPDIEIIYFISIEQKKELFKEITRCVSEQER